jgi:catabolite regulation protein CreA
MDETPVGAVHDPEVENVTVVIHASKGIGETGGEF